MSKLVLEVKNKEHLTQNDVIRYNPTIKCWEVVSYASFNNALYGEINKLHKELNEFKKSYNTFKNGVNERLKQYHDILQLLTKEN